MMCVSALSLTKSRSNRERTDGVVLDDDRKDRLLDEVAQEPFVAVLALGELRDEDLVLLDRDADLRPSRSAPSPCATSLGGRLTASHSTKPGSASMRSL